ncbi:MAG: hypothetical protein Aureis2KO_19110 [Aureisphaera sp.]
MKKYVFISFLVTIIGTTGKAQEVSNNVESSDSGFTTRSLSIMFPLGFYGDGDTGGGAFEADVTFEYGEHLFTLLGGIGESYDLFAPDDSFKQINLYYGREMGLSRTVFVEGHAGIGYFSFQSKGSGGFFSSPSEPIDDATIGFPIMGKLRIHTGPRFSIGLKLGANINAINIVHTFGISIQWNNRKW